MLGQGGYFFFVKVTINIMICTMSVNRSINASHVTMYIALLSLLIGGKRTFTLLFIRGLTAYRFRGARGATSRKVGMQLHWTAENPPIVWRHAASALE